MPLRETTFISNNVETWRKLEIELLKQRPDPDVLRDLYAAVSDDLSYARTHYPNRSVRSYLNHRAAELSLSLYKNDKGSTGFARFWRETVPLEIYTQRRPLQVALAIFLLAFAIGWFSSVVDPAFAELILSEGYVSMTEENIANNDPMAVYKDGSMLGGALGIMGNNLMVAMKCFVSGIFLGIGTLMIMIYNGVMVGSFQQFFFARGVGWESVLGIWTHGTIEISCIIVAGGAGLVLAKGLIWPGTLSRSRAFQLSGLSGLRIMAGIAPLIILAGIIEGFITRLTDIPTVLRVLFLLVNLFFVLYFFVIRPYQVGRQTERAPEDYGNLPPDRPLKWELYAERSTAQTFFESFRFFGKRGLNYFLAAIVFAIVSVVAIVYYFPISPSDFEFLNQNPIGPEVAAFFKGLSMQSAAIVTGLFLVVLPTLTYFMHLQLPGSNPDLEKRLATIVGLTIPWLILGLLTYVNVIVVFVFLPFIMLWMRGITYHGGKVGLGLRKASNLFGGEFGSVMLFFAMLTGFTFVLGLIAEVVWGQFGLQFIMFNIPSSWSVYFDTYMAVVAVNDLAILIIGLLFWVQGYGLLYHSLAERYTAEGLIQRVEKMLPV
ncbi:MAG: stage II sporulation protein M [Saprospiraceae bacterium]